jgi:hypothetical protein
VHEHVVDDVLGHRPQPARQPDAAVRRRARAPATVLVVDPAHAERLGQAVEVRGGQSTGADHQLVVATEGPAAPLLARLQLGHHLRHPAPLLGRAEGRRDEDDGAPLLPVGGHRPATPCAAADLDVAQGGGSAREITLRRRRVLGSPARTSSRQGAAGPAAGKGRAGRLGARVSVWSRSGHAGTVRHCDDTAPLRGHPLGCTSHGRWTRPPLHPVTRVALGGRSTVGTRAFVQVGPAEADCWRRPSPALSPVRAQRHAASSPRAPQPCPQAVGNSASGGPVSDTARHTTGRPHG